MNKFIDYSLFKGYAMAIFYKEDGSYRRMVCTTNLKYIPVNKWPVNDPLPWDDTVRVFSLDDGEWRSFKKKNFIGLVPLER